MSSVPPDEPLSWLWHFDGKDGTYTYSQPSFYMAIYQRYLLAPIVSHNHHMEDMDLNCGRPGRPCKSTTCAAQLPTCNHI